jgi:tetratricopeptide (TPR) repeat protein
MFHLLLLMFQFSSLVELSFSTDTAMPVESEKKVLVSLSLNLNGGGESEQIQAELKVLEGECSHDSVINFGKEHNVDSGSLFNLKRQLDARATSQEHLHIIRHPVESHNTLGSDVLIKKARKQLSKGQYLKAGRNLLHHNNSPDEDVGEELRAMLGQVIEGERLHDQMQDLKCGQPSYTGVLERLSQLSPKSGDFPLKIAECHAETDKYSLALQTTASVLKATGFKGRWKDEQSRTKAVLLAHQMSLELGDIEAASKKLSVALRADPNCDAIKVAFSKLKKIRKSVKAAKKDLQKTYNKRALGALESALEMTAAYNLTTDVLKGKLMLDLCLAMARVRRHEKALIVCNEAIDLTNITMDGLFMDTGQLASAFIARGESLVADYDYSEAVRDFRSAFDIASQGEIQDDARQKQQNAEWKARVRFSLSLPSLLPNLLHPFLSL